LIRGSQFESRSRIQGNTAEKGDADCRSSVVARSPDLVSGPAAYFMRGSSSSVRR
jgi:hypothetical protein